MTLAPSKKKFLGRFDIDDLAYLRKETEPFTGLSLFSGCGGAALGLRASGIEIRAFVEWDKAACQTLRANWVDRPENWREIKKKEEKRVARRLARAKDERRRHVIEMQDTPPYWWQERVPAILNVDITTLSADDLLKAADLRVGEATILEGGFPCQGFSMANSRRNSADYAADKRNTLYLELVRILRGTLPKTFMLENVRGLISMGQGKVLKMICNDLANSGYNVTWQLLNAADYGVPQNRHRIFIIGERVDVLGFNGQATQLHIAGAVGKITHPNWFLKKYPDQVQLSLFDQLSPTK